MFGHTKINITCAMLGVCLVLIGCKDKEQEMGADAFLGTYNLQTTATTYYASGATSVADYTSVMTITFNNNKMPIQTAFFGLPDSTGTSLPVTSLVNGVVLTTDNERVCPPRPVYVPRFSNTEMYFDPSEKFVVDLVRGDTCYACAKAYFVYEPLRRTGRHITWNITLYLSPLTAKDTIDISRVVYVNEADKN